MLLIRPVPRVRFRNSLEKPIRPARRDAVLQAHAAAAVGSMLTSSPLRSPSACITPPWCWSSMSAGHQLDRLVALAVDVLEHHARLATASS
jgi:hypothetical protein